MKPAEIPMRLMQRLLAGRIWELEDALAARPGGIHAAPGSPERFEILSEVMKRGGHPPSATRSMPHVMASVLGIQKSLRTLDSNPQQPRTRIAESDLAALEAFAHSAGVDDIGYARLAPELVFQGKAVLHPNAIVMTMEMDKGSIDTTPSERSFVEVHKTYHHLGRAANKIAGWLRRRGYSAHAGHPLMGLALYPPLAQQAGLGWRGLHGLLITPRFGPRVRLAAVFTGIENLPLAVENPHGWIEHYCQQCRRCARECPPRAILEEPIARANGLVTCTSVDRCFPYFADNYGCSICIRVCPFENGEYATLKHLVSNRRGA